MPEKVPPLETPEWAKERLDRDIAEAHARYNKRMERIKERERLFVARLSDLSDEPPSLRLVKHRNERLRKALELRRSGKKLREIGEALGVTGAMARVLVLRAERLEQRGELRFDVPISGRAANVLRWYGVKDLSPEAVASAVSASGIAELPGVGRKTVHEIAYWLRAHGMTLKP